jgi:hypothetical protein
MPQGGEVRFCAATKGPLHKIKLSGSTLGKRVQNAMRDKTRNLSWRRDPSNWLSSRSTRVDFRVWLEMRASLSPPTPREAKLILSDGRRLLSSGGSGSGLESLYHSSTFGYVPFREKTLRYTCILNGGQFEFAFKNPFYRDDLPVWSGSPLPQTKQSGDLELTLRKLAIDPTERFQQRQGFDWVARPSWSIKKAGENADKWFEVGIAFEDPSGQKVNDCGLFAEPVWKVCANAKRTNNYPFREDEVAWLGIARPEAPSEQTYQLFKFDLASQGDRGAKLAGIFGPGEYTVQDGAVTNTQPYKVGEPRSQMITSNSKTKMIQVNLDKPSLVVVSGRALRFVFRDLRGNPTELDEFWSHGGGERLTMLRLPKMPVRIGTADPGSWDFEFLIPAPEQPRNEKAGQP